MSLLSLHLGTMTPLGVFASSRPRNACVYLAIRVAGAFVDSLSSLTIFLEENIFASSQASTLQRTYIIAVFAQCCCRYVPPSVSDAKKLGRAEKSSVSLEIQRLAAGEWVLCRAVQCFLYVVTASCLATTIA